MTQIMETDPLLTVSSVVQAPRLRAPRAQRLHWECVPAFRDLLFDDRGLRLDEWLAAGQATIIKHGPHRTVYRVRLPELDFYVKRCRLANSRARIRELLRPAKARIEWTKAHRLAARGVPTYEPLGVGYRPLLAGPGDSYLVTRTIAGSEPLSFFVEETLPRFDPDRRRRLRLCLANTLGTTIANMHRAGVVHHDLHPGNLLIRLDADDRPELFLIDLHAVRIGAPLAWPARRNNLVLLNRWFALRVDHSDRLRFWRAYQKDPSLAPTDQQLVDPARELEERTWRSNLAFWKQRDRRCRATNRYYRRFRSPAVAGFAVNDLERTALQPFLDDPDEPFRRPGIRLLKDGRSSTVAELHLISNGVARPVIYKRFRITERLAPVVALLRPSAALRSWVHGHGLRERCLPTPRPLAVFHRRRCGLSFEGYLLTEKIENAVELQRFVADLQAKDAGSRRSELRRRIDQIARLVRELHRRQLSHRDLKAANILVCPDRGAEFSASAWRHGQGCLPVTSHTPIGTDSLWLIDLVGVRLHGRLGRKQRVQNLARLHASFHDHPALTRADKLRFLRVYLQWGLHGKKGWKDWWRAIAQATAAKVARNARVGRPLA